MVARTTPYDFLVKILKKSYGALTSIFLTIRAKILFRVVVLHLDLSMWGKVSSGEEGQSCLLVLFWNICNNWIPTRDVVAALEVPP
jgi:hypothetical protein